MITYKWEFPALDCAPLESGLADVIKTIHWRITAIEPKILESLLAASPLSIILPQALALYLLIQSPILEHLFHLIRLLQEWPQNG